MRTFTMRDAIRRAKMKSDMKATKFVTEDDWIDFFNEAYVEMYDVLIKATENYKVNTFFISVSNGTEEYDLPSDFYKSLSWDWVVNPNSNILVSLRPYMESERNNTVGNVSSIPNGQVRLRYVPVPQIFTTADLDTAVDGIAGFERMIVVRMAIFALDAEESNSDRLQRQWDQFLRDCEEAAMNRDQGLSQVVNDVYRVENSIYFPSLRYRLYGDKVRFLSTIQMGV